MACLNNYQSINSRIIDRMQQGILRNKPISKQIRYAVKIALFVVLAGSVALNIFFHDQLYLMGVNFIYDYQTSSATAGLTVFFNLVSLFGTTLGVAIVLGLTFLFFKRKLIGISYLIYLSINVYLIALSKYAFHEARPFWSTEQVQKLEWGCAKQYGLPSGHSWFSMLLFEPLITDWLGSGPYYVFMLVPLLAGFLIPFSRMYLGVHSSDQIVFGLLLSVISLVIYRYFAQRKLCQLVWHLMMPKNRRRFYFQLAIIFGLNLVILVGPIITYYLSLNNRYIIDADIARINDVCTINFTYEKLEKSSLVSCAVINLCFGIMCGLEFLNWDKEQDLLYKQYMVGRWKYDSIKQFFKELLLIIGLCAIPGGILLILIAFVIENAMWEFALACIALWCIGVILTGIGPMMAFRLNIIELTGNFPNSENQLEADLNQGNQFEQQKPKINRKRGSQNQSKYKNSQHIQGTDFYPNQHF